MLSRLLHSRLPLIAGALLWAASGAGCVANESYIVTLHDGRVYRSAQAPVLNPKTGYYQFRDRYDRDVLLRDREVATIVKDSSG